MIKRIVRFIPFVRLSLCEMQTALVRTGVAKVTSYNDNCYTTGAYKLIPFSIPVRLCHSALPRDIFNTLWDDISTYYWNRKSK